MAHITPYAKCPSSKKKWNRNIIKHQWAQREGQRVELDGER